MVAIYLGRQLGGHKHEEIGKTVGLGKASSVSSAYLLMNKRVAKEKELHRRVRRIEEALIKSKADLTAFLPILKALALCPHRHAAGEQGCGHCRKVHRRHRHPGTVREQPGELLQRGGPE